MTVRSKVAAAAVLAPALLTSHTEAAITEYPRDPSATPVARAIVNNTSFVRRGVFSAIPPSSKPVAVSTTRLAGFPRAGKSYAILSTGNARNAARPNSAPDSGSESRGPAIRGARDVVIMRIDLNVPKDANCLSFNFRFLTEEFPEFVKDIYNDAFIAEMDVSNWDASGKDDPTVTAPRNFAVDTQGRPIRVNAIGDTSVTAAQAKGTTYDGATKVLRASTRVKPGLRRLYLSIFDQGDRIFDSAVFVDKLIISKRSNCTSGVVVDS